MTGTDDGMEVDEYPLVENHTPFTWDDVDAHKTTADSHARQDKATQPPTMRWERAALWSFGTASADGALASKSATKTGTQWTHHSRRERPADYTPSIPSGPSLASRMTAANLPRKKNKPSKKQRDARKRRLQALVLGVSASGSKVATGEKEKGKAKKWGGWKRAFERAKASKKRVAAVKRRLADLAKRIGGPPIKGLHD